MPRGQYDINGRYGERFFDGLLGVQVTGNIEQRDRSNEQFSLDIENHADFNGRGFKYSDFVVRYTNEIRQRGGGSLLLDINTPDGGTIRFNNLYSQTNRDYITYQPELSQRRRRGELHGLGPRAEGQHLQQLDPRRQHLFDMNVNGACRSPNRETSAPYDYRMQFSEPPIVDSRVCGLSRNTSGRSPPETFIPFAYNNFAKAQLDSAFFQPRRTTTGNRPRSWTSPGSTFWAI